MIKLKNLLHENTISENLKYHIRNNITLNECVFRYGSKSHFDLINEARKLKSKGHKFDSYSNHILETDMGTLGLYEGVEVPLDFPMLTEAEYQGKKVELNKPKRGGSAKYYVYVKDPKSGNIRKVSFGAKGGGGKLAVKIKDPKARKAFADRHNCDTKKDRTKAGYWSCNLPRYAKQLGMGSNMNTFW